MCYIPLCCVFQRETNRVIETRVGCFGNRVIDGTKAIAERALLT